MEASQPQSAEARASEMTPPLTQPKKKGLSRRNHGPIDAVPETGQAKGGGDGGAGGYGGAAIGGVSGSALIVQPVLGSGTLHVAMTPVASRHHHTLLESSTRTVRSVEFWNHRPVTSSGASVAERLPSLLTARYAPWSRLTTPVVLDTGYCLGYASHGKTYARAVGRRVGCFTDTEPKEAATCETSAPPGAVARIYTMGSLAVSAAGRPGAPAARKRCTREPNILRGPVEVQVTSVSSDEPSLMTRSSFCCSVHVWFDVPLTGATVAEPGWATYTSALGGMVGGGGGCLHHTGGGGSGGMSTVPNAGGDGDGGGGLGDGGQGGGGLGSGGGSAVHAKQAVTFSLPRH